MFCKKYMEKPLALELANYLTRNPQLQELQLCSVMVTKNSTSIAFNVLTELKPDAICKEYYLQLGFPIKSQHKSKSA